jgi:SAM-dependent methyltransferase
MNDTPTEGELFWENHYRGRATPTTLRPSPVLVELAGTLTAGSALDLGCSRGDEAIWLAARGWRVTGVDVAESALAVGRQRAGVAALQIDFQRHDFARSFPEGRFDLVSALYLQSPVEFPRARVLKRAAAAVAPGGLLLVVEHASHRPWAWQSDPNLRFPPAEELLTAMEIVPAEWTTTFLGRRERQATGPNGETATVADNIAALVRTGVAA